MALFAASCGVSHPAFPALAQKRAHKNIEDVLDGPLRSLRLGMKIAPHAVPYFLLILILTAACGVNNSVPEPGDEGWVPADWVEPELIYETEEYFPSRVVDYRQAPGQYSGGTDFSIQSNTDKLMGPPSGAGIYAADNSSIVSLGMAGGYVTLEFEPPVEDHPDNMGGYDFIVYGNSFWFGGDPLSPTREPGVIHIMKDENGNGTPDDTWYLIPGSALDAGDEPVDIVYSLDSNGTGGNLAWTADSGAFTGNYDFSDSQPWWPENQADPEPFASVWLLSDLLYLSIDDYGSVWGYGDTGPTMMLGDLNGDGDTMDPEDYPGMEPAWFYSVPDSHGDNVIDPGSGGGSPIMIEWAVDPDFNPVNLDEISWIKITSASLNIDSSLGEKSTEVDGIVRVRRQ